MTSAAAKVANTVGWFILEGYPWWPVYVCDPFKLRPSLYHLGDGHKRILKKARDFPNDFTIVYFFGSGEFSIVPLKKGVLKPWECSERENFLKGHPKLAVKKSNSADDLKVAIQAAEDYLAQPEDTRLPPHMVPSDLDPTLEPPPPLERPEEEEEEGDEGGDGEEDGEDGGDDGDVDMASDAEDGDDGDESDDGGEKKKKKPKAKKSKPAKSEKPKKEKKKPAKEKKESASKKKKTTDKEEDGSKGKLKRQRSTSSANGGADAAEEAKPKQIKKEKQADVKTSQKQETPEELSALIETEMRWIISNCQYEEMTTKMVRKMLEERLKRDLRQHRDTIKAVVYRVIDSIEGEEDGAAESSAPAENVPVKKEDETMEPAAEEPTPEPTVKTEEGRVKNEEEQKAVVEEEGTTAAAPPQSEVDAKALTEATTELSLALDDETTICDVLHSLKKLTAIDRTQLEEAGLLPRLVELRSHRNSSVSSAVGELATLWRLEDAIPAPKPVQKADILKMKETLEANETPHDELLTVLNELERMALGMELLKDTGIPRSVAKLRQHANDKVSIAAKNLRNAWLQLVDKDKQPDNLKTLLQMTEVLESETEADSAKITVLRKLIKMSLTTKDIIEAKIGFTVSKLRKSTNEDVAAAADKLRKKWKNDAKSA